jgi:hypothetical protein
MKSILMMMTLLATATAVSAQTPPATPPEQGNYTRQSPQYFPPSLPYPLEATEAAQQASDCPFAKAMQEANIAWQRLRAMCGGAKTAGCNEPCCGLSNACKGCGTGIAGCAKGSEAAQPPKSCCCAKACACCETCKAAKTQEAVQVEQVQIPMACPMTMLPPMAGWKMQCGPGGVQMVAQPMPAPPMMGPHVTYMAVNLGARPAKLVTPDFEAHCDHMIQRGDTIQLVGNVMLLCKKYAQPLRIEGQRILLNLNDGSFVVETGPALPRPVAPAIGVGVMRMSISESGIVRPASSLVPPCMPDCVLRTAQPAAGIIEVVPVPPAPVTSPRPR